MKICPQCKTTYSDDTLNFCLEDGSALAQDNAVSDPPPTVVIPPPRKSVPQQTVAATVRSDEIRTSPRYEMPQKKGSKAWLWVLGILLGLGVLCGGGFIGLVALVPIDEEPPEEKPETIKTPRPKRTADGDPTRRLAQEEELGGWEINDNEYISSGERNGALVLTSKDNYFYVILSKGFETYDASTLLKVRNLTGEKSISGYGLVIHSYPTAVLDRDYAFVIRSDNGTYRVVQHTNKKERTLVRWTKSNAIKRGTGTNTLEVRVSGRNMSFYINGEFVKKIRDYTNYKEGVAGVYTSDEIPIAFSKLELRK